MNGARTALACALLGVAIQGCTIYTKTEASQMQADIRDIKLELNRIKESFSDTDRKMLYSLMAIEEKLDIRQETLGSALRDVDARLADVPESVAMSAQPPRPPSTSFNAVSPASPDPPAGFGYGTLPPDLEAPTPINAAPVSGVASAGVMDPQLAGITPDQVFLEGTMAWVDGDVDRARQRFEQFYAQWPNHPRASDARFWIGECHYKNERFPEAIQAYQDVVQRYPGSQMEAEAAAKIGYSYYRLNDIPRAREALQRVVDRHPNYGQIERIRETLAALP